MSLHIGATKGQIAQTVLMPGDPLRAQFIAENFLDNAVRYSEIRNMYGYTGTYKGVPVSVQGSGMGMPSMGIYSFELFSEYEVENYSHRYCRCVPRRYQRRRHPCQPGYFHRLQLSACLSGSRTVFPFRQL